MFKVRELKIVQLKPLFSFAQLDPSELNYLDYFENCKSKYEGNKNQKTNKKIQKWTKQKR